MFCLLDVTQHIPQRLALRLWRDTGKRTLQMWRNKYWGAALQRSRHLLDMQEDIQVGWNIHFGTNQMLFRLCVLWFVECIHKRSHAVRTCAVRIWRHNRLFSNNSCLVSLFSRAQHAMLWCANLVVCLHRKSVFLNTLLWPRIAISLCVCMLQRQWKGGRAIIMHPMIWFMKIRDMQK